MFLTRILLVCGAIASSLYILSDIAAATLFYPGYDYTAQQVSELSALGAPSRTFWMVMGVPYALLTLAFAVGVWRAAEARWTLQVTAVLIALFAVNGFSWGWVAPMHMRGTQFTETDTLHIAFAASAVLLMVGFISFAAASLGRGFVAYSAATIAAMLLAGGIVSTQIAAIAADQSTPWMGSIERISVYGPIVWMAILAIVLIRKSRTAPRSRSRPFLPSSAR